MMTLAVLATLAFVAVAANSYRVELPFEGLHQHVVLTLGTVSALLLPHFWVLFYLVGTGRVLRAAGSVESSRRRLFGLMAITILLLLAVVVTSVLLGGPAAVRLHKVVFAFAGLLQLATLAVQWQELRHNARQFRDAPA